MLLVFPSQKGFCFGFQRVRGEASVGYRRVHSHRFTHEFPRRSSFLWVGLMPEVVERSLKIEGAFALRGSDSVHLASALQLRDDLAIDAGEFALVTSDQELKSAAMKAGLAVIDPHEQGETPARPTV